MTSKELKEKKEYLQNQYENKKTIIISINVDILIELIENQERLEEENAKLKQKLEEIKSFSYSMPPYYYDVIKEMIGNE